MGGLGASSSVSKAHHPLPELGWLGLEIFQGRPSQAPWQTNAGAEPPQERLKDFILIPKLLARRGCHKSERDFVVVSSGASFLLLVGNLPSQASPSLLPGGGKAGKGPGESGREEGRQATGRHH